MKRHGRNLESEADGDHYEGSDQQRISAAGSEFAPNAGQAEFAGETVDVTKAEKEEGGGHSAKQKILQARLRRTDALFIEGSHGVKAKAEKFQGDEDHQQVFRADKEHH